jgi:isopenicillin N synthase-like dioxygenase
VHSNEPGLQVRSRVDNSWIAVPANHGCLVVNIGDSLSSMTRGVLRATPHRVAVDCERTSVAFFFEPPLDMIVEPISGSVFLDAHPQRQPGPGASPFRYGDYLHGKYGISFPAAEKK